MSLFKKRSQRRYRIVRDMFCGYCVQYQFKTLWFLGWEKLDFGTITNANTFSTVEEAEETLQRFINKIPQKSGDGFVGDIVKEIDGES